MGYNMKIFFKNGKIQIDGTSNGEISIYATGNRALITADERLVLTAFAEAGYTIIPPSKNEKQRQSEWDLRATDMGVLG
jgi:hypothetical protein